MFGDAFLLSTVVQSDLFELPVRSDQSVCSPLVNNEILAVMQRSLIYMLHICKSFPSVPQVDTHRRQIDQKDGDYRLLEGKLQARDALVKKCTDEKVGTLQGFSGHDQ